MQLKLITYLNSDKCANKSSNIWSWFGTLNIGLKFYLNNHAIQASKEIGPFNATKTLKDIMSNISYSF